MDELSHAYLVAKSDIVKAAIAGNPQVWQILTYQAVLPGRIATPDYNIEFIRDVLTTAQEPVPGTPTVTDTAVTLARRLRRMIFFIYKGYHHEHIETAQSLSPDKNVQDCLTIALGLGAKELWSDEPINLSASCSILVITTKDLLARLVSSAKKERVRIQFTIKVVLRAVSEGGLGTWAQFFAFFEFFERSNFDSLIVRWVDNDPTNKRWVDFRTPHTYHDTPLFALTKCLRFPPGNETHTSEEFLLLVNVDTPFGVFDFPQSIFHQILDPGTPYKACLLSGRLRRVLKTTLPFLLYLSDGKYRPPAKRQELFTYLRNIERASREHRLNFSVSLNFDTSAACQLMQKEGGDLFSGDFPREEILEDWTLDATWHLNYIAANPAAKWEGMFVPRLDAGD